MTAGYEGEAGDGSSYQEYLKGRRGDPLKWGIGAYAKKDLLGDKGFTFGGYGHYGKLNVSGGYNTQTGPEFKAGIGIPIRKTGGVRKFSNGGKKDKGQKDNNENKKPADKEPEKDDFEDIKIKRREKQIMNTFLKMEDGRYVFFSKDKDNMISLIVEDGSNVTVNYDNRGSIINAKFNSGNNVLFNIKQQ